MRSQEATISRDLTVLLSRPLACRKAVSWTWWGSVGPVAFSDSSSRYLDSRAPPSPSLSCISPPVPWNEIFIYRFLNLKCFPYFGLGWNTSAWSWTALARWDASVSSCSAVGSWSRCCRRHRCPRCRRSSIHSMYSSSCWPRVSLRCALFSFPYPCPGIWNGSSDWSDNWLKSPHLNHLNDCRSRPFIPHLWDHVWRRLYRWSIANIFILTHTRHVFGN